MLSSDDNQGIIYFLVGIIVIVLTAVGLSIIVDKRIHFSSGKGFNQRELAASTAELEELRSLFEVRTAILNEQQSKAQTHSLLNQKLLKEMSNTSERKSELLAKKIRITEELTTLDSSFFNNRSDYRNKTWAKAVGESHPRLALRGGRVYRDTTITKVTEVGLEVRHADGNARIQAPDLDAHWQERFQWDNEERRSQLKDEEARLQAIPAPKQDPPAGQEPFFASVTPIPIDPLDAEKIANLSSLRNQVIKWKSMVSTLSSERSIAASNASRGFQNSVPGSLETWGAKATRLGNTLVHAQGQLAKARAELATISPSDPLLHVTYDSRY